jgi:ABC-type multidrug transport system fused ATPase/permease subunit
VRQAFAMPSSTSLRSPAARFAAAHARAFAAGHWPLLVRLAILLLIRTAAAVLAILLIRDFLTGVLAEPTGVAARLTAAFGQTGALWTVVGLLLAVSTAGAISTYAGEVTLQKIVRLLELQLMERLLTHLLRLPVSFFDQRHRGDLIESIRQDVSATRSVSTAAIEMVFFASQTLAYAGSALFISPRLVLVALPMLLAAMLPARWFAVQMRRRSYRLRRRGYRLTDLLLQLFHGVRIVKVYAGEAAEIRNSVATARRYFDDLVAAARIKALGDVVLEGASSLMAVIVIVVGGLEVLNGRLTVASLVAVLLAIRAAFGPLNKGFGQFLQIQRDWASVDRVRELLETEPDLRDRDDALPLVEPIRTIRFEEVGFGYAGGAPVLAGVSFEIAAGQHVGVVGPSGAGKTTLVSLLARFYDPGSGRIVVNGRDLRDYRRSEFYQRVALVTQDPFVFGTTVRDNIRYGCPGASEADVEAAARDAEIHEEILSLPKGYDTVLGVGGRILSTGQIQRVNVARAILKRAELVILDEATSNLDSISEKKIQAALERLMEGRTTVTIAHRLSTLRQADVILVIGDGGLVAAGAHAALLRDCALYRRLWEAQSSPTGVAVLQDGR